MFPGVTAYPENLGFDLFSKETIALHNSHGIPFNNDQITAMRSYKSPTVLHNNFLTLNEFQTLENLLLSNPIWHFSSNGSNFGGINNEHPFYKEICDIVLPKILEEHEPLSIDSFFLRESGRSLTTHTDTRNTSIRSPYKTFLFPIGVKKQGHFTDNWQHVGTVTFNQYSYIMPIPGSSKIENIEYSTNENIDVNDYQKYLTHDQYNRLFGMSIEKICDWIPCSMIEFEMSRLHASTDWAAYNIDSKWALTIVTTKSS